MFGPALEAMQAAQGLRGMSFGKELPKVVAPFEDTLAGIQMGWR